MLFPGQGSSQLADVDLRLLKGLRHSWKGRGFCLLLLDLEYKALVGSAGGKNVALPPSEL